MSNLLKGYKIGDTLYIFPQEAAVIYNDEGADKIAVQPEDLAAWKEINSEVADKLFGYNYNTMTINKKAWADYINEDIPSKAPATTYNINWSDAGGIFDSEYTINSAAEGEIVNAPTNGYNLMEADVCQVLNGDAEDLELIYPDSEHPNEIQWIMPASNVAVSVQMPEPDPEPDPEPELPANGTVYEIDANGGIPGTFTYNQQSETFAGYIEGQLQYNNGDEEDPDTWGPDTAYVDEAEFLQAIASIPSGVEITPNQVGLAEDQTEVLEPIYFTFHITGQPV